MAKAQRKKASKKDFILLRASAMFREKGFPATSMRDLAEAVGIEAASLYNHIKSKSDILQEIVFRTANDCNMHQRPFVLFTFLSEALRANVQQILSVSYSVSCNAAEHEVVLRSATVTQASPHLL